MRIRPLRWVIRAHTEAVGVGAQRKVTLYNTPIDATDTRLFWIDFVRHIFAKRFSQQRAITKVNEFDLTQRVVLSDSLDLTLPMKIEAIMYYAMNAENVDSVKLFEINVHQKTVHAWSCALVLLAWLIYVVLKIIIAGRSQSSSSSSLVLNYFTHPIV